MNAYQVWTVRVRQGTDTLEMPALITEAYYLLNIKERRILNRYTNKQDAETVKNHLNARVVILKREV